MVIQNNSNERIEFNVIIEYGDEKYSAKDKNAFAKFIRDQLKIYNEDHEGELKTRDLADRVGISYEMFRKILNKQKPTDKRDCIIAICYVLDLWSDEINDALTLYGYLPHLTDDNPRDMCIKIQTDQKKSNVSVSELNECLIKNGFPELNIHDRRDGKNKNKNKKDIRVMPYKIMEKRVKTPVSIDYYYGDPYNSLRTEYSPYNIMTSGEMVIQSITTKEFILLTAHSDGTLYSQVIRRDDHPTHYKSTEDTGDYKEYFAELNQAVFMEKNRLLAVLNDTKNYGVRTSARLINDAITVFSEKFNYTIPELNEYYFMDLSKGKHTLLVYPQSAFMKKYLSEDEYKKHYGPLKFSAAERYDSVQQIDDMLKEKDRHTDEYIRLQMRKKAFVDMCKNVDELYEKLKTRKQFIQNLDYIYDNPYDVLRYYKLEDEFECKYDEEFSEITECLPSKEFALPDGKKIEITVEDIKHAFELGYENIARICELKARLGSVEAVL